MKTMFFLAVVLLFAGVQADVNDCTINSLGDAKEVLNNCQHVFVGNLSIPSNADPLVWKLNLQIVTFKGNVTFDANYQDRQPLLTITGSNFTINSQEKGVLDGQGAAYWDGKGILSDVRKPILLRLDQVEQGLIHDLNISNCPQTCVEISRSKLVRGVNLNIDVEDGLQDGLAVDTHGITVINSTLVEILNTTITTQGDCISSNQGSLHHFENVTCYYSQGLAVRPEWTFGNYLKEVLFNKCRVFRGQTGVRVVTSPNQPAGVIKDIRFTDIQVSDILFRGIDVRQDLGNEGRPGSNIKLTHLNITNIQGYMTNKYMRSVYINCGRDGCADWYWSKIDIKKAEVENACNFLPYGWDCW